MNDYYKFLQKEFSMTQSQYFEFLAKEMKTDKFDHGYMPLYAKYLPDKCRSLCEIGAAKGASLFLWRAIFGDDCDISVIDLFMDILHVSVPWCKRNNFTPYQCDQSDIPCLSSIKKMFEVIVEDGSHRADHMQITFKHLFLNNLKSGGLWVTEDLHCCDEPYYYAGLVEKFEDTFFSVMKEFVKTGVLSGPYFNEEDNKIFSALIDKVALHEEEGIVFIWKK